MNIQLELVCNVCDKEIHDGQSTLKFGEKDRIIHSKCLSKTVQKCETNGCNELAVYHNHQHFVCKEHSDIKCALCNRVIASGTTVIWKDDNNGEHYVHSLCKNDMKLIDDFNCDEMAKFKFGEY